MDQALSAHLLDSYYSSAAQEQSKSLVNKPMSFNPQSHGAAAAASLQHAQPVHGSTSMEHNPFDVPYYMPDISEATARKIASLQVKLNQRLGPEYISQRPGPGGGPKLTYVEGWKIINLANEVFGFNGWCSSVVNVTTDFIDAVDDGRRFNIGVTAVVKVMLRDGVYHEDLGYGTIENARGKGAALDKCKKEAITDGLKRALRNFGNLLGNCLYDKSYTQEVTKMKIPTVRFDQNQLHRRPEFEPPNKAGPSKPTTTTTTTTTSTTSTVGDNAPQGQFETPMRQPLAQTTNQTTKTSLPAHIIAEMEKSMNVEVTTPVNKGKGPAFNSGLQTPITPNIPPNNRPQNNNQQRQASPTPLVGGAGGSGVGGSGAGNAAASISKAGQMLPPPKPHQPRALASALSERNVSASETPTTGDLHLRRHEPSEDSFSFFSDDDAMLATIDLGDGDLGRPIDFDEGSRGVESESQDLYDATIDDQSLLAALKESEDMYQEHRMGGPKAGGSGYQLQQPHQEKQSAQQPQQNQRLQGQLKTFQRSISKTGVTNLLSKLPQHLQRPSGPRSIGLPSNVASGSGSSNQPHQGQHQSLATRLSSTLQQGGFDVDNINHMAVDGDAGAASLPGEEEEDVAGNGNGDANTSSSNAVGNTAQLAGSFNFPPGVNIAQLRGQQGRPPNIGAGMKRSADAMLTGNPNRRAPGVGMGLQQAQAYGQGQRMTRAGVQRQAVAEVVANAMMEIDADTARGSGIDGAGEGVKRMRR